MTDDDWQNRNRRQLSDEIRRIRDLLLRHAEENSGQEPRTPVSDPNPPGRDTALGQLSDAFQLSGFERDILLLCAAYELMPQVGEYCAAAQNDPDTAYPTMRLALDVFEDGDWSVLSEARPLRYWGLLKVDESGPLVNRRLEIDSVALAYLIDGTFYDQEVAGILKTIGYLSAMMPSRAQLAVQRRHT